VGSGNEKLESPTATSIVLPTALFPGDAIVLGGRCEFDVRLEAVWPLAVTDGDAIGRLCIWPSAADRVSPTFVLFTSSLSNAVGVVSVGQRSSSLVSAMSSLIGKEDGWGLDRFLL
jgi:hypothetical protein